MQHDAIVIGGSFAGLSAAIHIARARRSVCVIDSGSPRNRFADVSHGFFGQDGSPPHAMIAGAGAQVQRYPRGIGLYSAGKAIAVVERISSHAPGARTSGAI
jgi:thioredoxin reductase